jgi:hypothetical protein
MLQSRLGADDYNLWSKLASQALWVVGVNRRLTFVAFIGKIQSLS